MRIFFLLTGILFCFSGMAQTPFQGTVVYTLKAPGEKDDAALTIFFGVRKIKLKFKEDKEKDFESKYSLVDLDSGKVYVIDDNSRTYRVRKLYEDPKPEPVSDKIILGHKTRAVPVASSGSRGVLKGISGGAIVFYVSQEHYFPVPQKFAGAPELLLVHDNYIVLGGTLTMGNPMSGFEDEEEYAGKTNMVITAEAKQIEPRIISVDEFRIPDGYSKAKRPSFDYPDSVDMTGFDTVAVMADSTIATPPVQQKVPKPAPKKTTAPVKGEAIKKKKT
jgi:hypothetical protein